MIRSLPRLLLPAGALGALAFAASCARQGIPPGGPQDRRPPVVVAVAPDTFAAVEPGRGTIRIDFDERISERPAEGLLEDAVRVSPRTGEVRVSTSRRGLEVSLGGGFRPGLVYRVRVEPVLTDLFNNRMRAPFEWVFSTGGEFQENAAGGLVWDRITGDPVEGVQVELRRGAPEDPGFDTLPPHWATTDTSGIFALRYLPEGTYTVTAFQDRNANDQPDAFELQGSSPGLAVAATDTVVTQLSVMAPDTTPPRVVRVETIDSVTLRVTMDDPIDPGDPLARVVPGLYREEGDAPGVQRILHERAWLELRDSLVAAEAERARAAGDTVAEAAPDTVPTDTVAEPPPLLTREEIEAGRGERVETAQGGEPAGRATLPDGSPVPERSFVVRLAGPLEPGEAYTVRVEGVTNIVGLTSGQEEAVVTRPVPPTPAAAPPDTAGADPTGVPPDTMAARAGALVPAANPVTSRPATLALPVDTVAAPRSTAAVPIATRGAVRLRPPGR